MIRLSISGSEIKRKREREIMDADMIDTSFDTYDSDLGKFSSLMSLKSQIEPVKEGSKFL